MKILKFFRKTLIISDESKIFVKTAIEFMAKSEMSAEEYCKIKQPLNTLKFLAIYVEFCRKKFTNSDFYDKISVIQQNSDLECVVGHITEPDNREIQERCTSAKIQFLHHMYKNNLLVRDPEKIKEVSNGLMEIKVDFIYSDRQWREFYLMVMEL